ncbi:efflux RND transporter periplasmic adaptor subunit [Paucibacter sp. Y2R2-4]|uniref:efflux RND transporter periplasmic adaptor subunit n=1 Tax=Paucibacter sp. Y2R2-4 TaxID=2893553 RepID=UPI0021E4EE78|nr:efflux RND transporter periplasmic adaptor subunit [Paucibacter sp. Y2R2-4]MCV2348241.1 efflux RND transporter periplasmic adaptor subunit [Paucibacter sp. Y2R2-4]
MPQPQPLSRVSKRAMGGRILIPLLTLLTLVLGLSACQKKEAVAPKALPPAPVKVVASRSETVPVNNEYVGRVAAYRSVEVRARVEGILERRHFVEGAEVKKGDLLYTIDPTPYRIALNDAQADQARSAANLASARSKERRLAPLVKENAISQQDYDDAVTAVKQTEALLAVSNANVERAQTNLGYTRVTATESGKIGAALVPEGRLVGRGESTHLTTVDRLDQVYVNFNVADRDALILRRELSAGRVKTGEGTGSAQARLFLPDGSEFERSGRLDFSESQVNPSTGTITLRVVMPNPAQKLLPGMYVRVVYTAGARPDTILIPQKAVTKTPTGHIAWVVGPENKVERRDLVVGEWLKSDWIIEKGLGAGEKVVVEGLQRLQQGAVVSPSPWTPGAGGAAGSPAAAAALPSSGASR